MTRLSMLANSPQPLADVLVDRLRRYTKVHSRRESGDHDKANALQLDLPMDLPEADADVVGAAADAADEPAAVRVLHPDEVAVAILLGRAFEERRALLARLQDRETIVLIETSPELVSMVRAFLRRHVFNPHTRVLEGSELDGHGDDIAPAGTVAMFIGKDDGKFRQAAPGNGRFASALQQRCAVIGIAADPERFLPPGLVRLCTDRIVVPPLDGAAVASVIEAITGRHPGDVADTLAGLATLETLNLAVRADLGAERSLARLGELVDYKDKAAEFSPTLSELHGLGAAREWGLALIRDLKDYVAGHLPWTAVDRGALLTGLPGTGKTTFARALAKQAGVHFIATSYSAWQAHKDGHLGSVTQAMRNVFAEARQNAPAILFIDEIDTLPARGSGRWNDDWWTAITTALLEQLDGFEPREGVVVIGACNNPDRLDPALIRAGRLDRSIEIPLPDVPALIGIFRMHLGQELAAVDLREVALAARGHTGADVERWVREARRKARSEGTPLAHKHLIEAVRGGAPELPVEMRHRFAYHEAGHAVVVQALGLAQPKALSLGEGGGVAENDMFHRRPQTRAHVEHFLLVLLAGRASEELVFGEPTAGAGGSDQSDLARATGIALQIEASFGLGALGLLYIGEEPEKRDLLHSPELRAAVARRLERAHAAALDLLRKNRPALDALAEALFAKSYLDRPEIAAIFEQTALGAEVPTRSPDVPSSEGLTSIRYAADNTAASADRSDSDDGRHLAPEPSDSGSPQ